MSLDLEKIKAKVAAMNGEKPNRQNSNLWKPDVGEYRIRVIPVDQGPTDIAFVREFYYNVGPGVTRPASGPNPIEEFIKVLRSTKDKESMELAKKLYPKRRAFLPIIVRGQEDQGVKLWGISPGLYAKLLAYLFDEEIGDFRDVDNGLDLKVKVTKVPGKRYNDTSVSTALSKTKLHSDPKVVASWLNNVPNIDEIYKQKSPEELKEALEKWIEGGAKVYGDDNTDFQKDSPGVERNGGGDDKQIDNLKSEIASKTAAVESKEKLAKATSTLDSILDKLQD